MPDSIAAKPRKPRADAQRNRDRLLQVAKAAFAEIGPAVSLDEIARRAGVGIGTLYRHFPTRDALVEGVYRNETRRLVEAAANLDKTHAPVDALRAWMLMFVDYIATKQVMASALNALIAGPSDLYAASGPQMIATMTRLADRAVASGEIRLDFDPVDLLRALAGVANVAPTANWQDSARILVDVLIAGLRAPRAADEGL
ncbi:TetR/AcrR family transcriptional regulator [Gluconacetobacter diazotrophicus]|uniref:TetR/AcrR family transcriptional regulator n=1 Tax=Gluconacetobacter diazotrophicus TaxID=33996 RepID=UPI0002D4D887|nr:TetR/AcrR family transcriptional regulator [Gluconacetobacter diazotrophicus]